MPGPQDFNTRNIEEFRRRGGHVGGPFEGAPLILLHHRGRRSNREFVAPVMYLAADTDPDNVIYVFASKGGAPTNPDWYDNLVAAGATIVERGTETYPVAVQEITGEQRDAIYAEQAERYPGFAEYEKKTAGIRTIPVLQLTRR
ncbi:nitroreductase family deazaflavin-dependent oxidoreductase [Microlunatus elymi]|uniref:Nitroreductase family deazaflavin-dependent oxidoreductase n=1 Tax=Microlunatus elymi TaxID=2596828 RepID=A0A516PZV9_9ACTN|nr:nitroreductase family deazaflavin-dependent oxidoreductase [Microlunatus elymi]QDP96687.1 nitroreductase family deazaflavin-dependent oxidoreductase [Microlunatus elymi]